MILGIGMLAGLVDSIIQEIGANDRREHERHMQELKIIESSSLRDEYVKQLLLDRILYPVEQAQHDIQNAAKHAQWLSEIVLFYYHDHGLTEDQAYELSKQFKLLAIEITHADSLHDLKFVYAVVTMFNDHIARFRHRTQEYSIQYNIRKHILDKLNTCIATGNNFKVREELMQGLTEKAILPGLTINYQPEPERKPLVPKKESIQPADTSEVYRLRGKFGGDEEKTEIFIKVKEIMVDKIGLENPDQVTLDSHLYNHLGADALDLVELVMALEDEFEIEISDDDQNGFLDLHWSAVTLWSGSSSASVTPGDGCIVRNFVELIYEKKRSF